MRMGDTIHGKVFWSGGSQAVRLPKAVRVQATEVTIERRGNTIVLEPLPEDGWEGFWERLLPLRSPVRRHATKAAERRKPV
jgi:antitoxin VapB